MENDVAVLLRFIKTAEKLKTELRHSYTSSRKRRESVAEHSWMLALMAMLIFDASELNVDKLKVMKMVIIHDLAEAITGDIPSFEKSERQSQKVENELSALKTMTQDLPDSLKLEILELWHEMEGKETLEAKLAQSLDKLEVLIQHNIADIDTWDQGDYDTNPYFRDEYFDFNPFMRAFKDIINRETMTKVINSGNKSKISKTYLEKFERTEKSTT